MAIYNESVLSFLGLLLAVAVLVAIAVLLWRNYQGALARPLRDVASANGWRYDEVGPDRLLPRFRKFGPLRRAWPGEMSSFGRDDDADIGDHAVRHVISGQVRGHHFHLFEYDHLPPADRRKAGGRKQQYTLAAVRTGAFCPGLVVRRRRSLPRALAEKPNDAGFQDKAFNARFRVTAADPDFARRALNKRNRDWMHRTAVDWEWKGHWLVIWWEGRLKAPDCIPALKKLTGFTDRLPADMRPQPKQEPTEAWQEEGWPEAR